MRASRTPRAPGRGLAAQGRAAPPQPSETNTTRHRHREGGKEGGGRPGTHTHTRCDTVG